MDFKKTISEHFKTKKFEDGECIVFADEDGNIYYAVKFDQEIKVFADGKETIFISPNCVIL